MPSKFSYVHQCLNCPTHACSPAHVSSLNSSPKKKKDLCVWTHLSRKANLSRLTSWRDFLCTLYYVVVVVCVCVWKRIPSSFIQQLSWKNIVCGWVPTKTPKPVSVVLGVVFFSPSSSHKTCVCFSFELNWIELSWIESKVFTWVQETWWTELDVSINQPKCCGVSHTFVFAIYIIKKVYFCCKRRLMETQIFHHAKT